MQVHHANFGSKTAIRCGSRREKYNMASHIHQFPEIVYVKEGSLEITVDDVTETMVAGDFAIIAPFRVHSFKTEIFVDRWVCVFSNDIISNFLTHDEFYGVGETCVFHASDGLRAFAQKHIIESNEYFFTLTDEIIRSVRALVFAVYEEYLRTVPRLQKKKYHQALSSILLYISEHYLEDISLSMIGSALGYSPKYVSLCLAEIDGMNLSFLVNSFRSDNAKTLLTTTSYRMIDIALECGYSNERSFYRAFMQVTGMTPGEYRKSKHTIITQENESDTYYHLYEAKKEKHRLKIKTEE
jgi:AraC-like DNA-binding protein